MQIHDVNSSGKISVRELIHLVTTGNSTLEDLLKRADRIVSSLDCDDDNEITSDEFIASLHHRPQLMDNFSQSTTVSVETAAAIRELHQSHQQFSAERLRSVPIKFAGHMHLLTQKVNKQGFRDFMKKCFDCGEGECAQGSTREAVVFLVCLTAGGGCMVALIGVCVCLQMSTRVWMLSSTQWIRGKLAT